MKKLFKMLSKRFLIILFIIFTFFIVASGNTREKIVTYNVNNVKSVQAVHIVNKYNSLLESNPQNKTIKVKQVGTFWEAMQIAPREPVGFTGTMTSYGPDCAGCSGKSGCPPRQDFREGNIYFNDSNYGTVRVVATDSSIPCGTMVRITTAGASEPIYAVALDRGGAIKQNKMDLLYESNSAATRAGTKYNVKFEIVRWGW